MSKTLNDHLKEISPKGWKAKVAKYGLKRAKEMMAEQSRKYWATHKVVHKKIRNGRDNLTSS